MNTSRTSQGYTLVELILAVGLFSIVMLLASTAYLSLIDMSRNARAKTDLTNNLSFAVESMARSIRSGSNYNCDYYGNGDGEYCDSGGNECFLFTNVEGENVVYARMDNGSIGRAIGSQSCDAVLSPLTDPNVIIENLRFYTQGASPQDMSQPYVVIVVNGYVEVKQGGQVHQSRFSIQTQATQRFLDI